MLATSGAVKNKIKKIFYAIAVVLAFTPGIHLLAQNKTQDTLVFRHSASTATILSAVLPGAGQVYNHKYWKVPVIYGAAATMIYFVNFNQKYYLEFKKAYKYRIDGDTTTIDHYPWASKESLLNQKDRWRRYRDMNLIGLGILYFLNIIDANVDAHFFDYEINDDLSIRVEPLLFGNEKYLTLQHQAPLGVTLRVTF